MENVYYFIIIRKMDLTHVKTFIVLHSATDYINHTLDICLNFNLWTTLLLSLLFIKGNKWSVVEILKKTLQPDKAWFSSPQSQQLSRRRKIDSRLSTNLTIHVRCTRTFCPRLHSPPSRWWLFGRKNKKPKCCQTWGEPTLLATRGLRV